jgi:hypothetical protein
MHLRRGVQLSVCVALNLGCQPRASEGVSNPASVAPKPQPLAGDAGVPQVDLLRKSFEETDQSVAAVLSESKPCPFTVALPTSNSTMCYRLWLEAPASASVVLGVGDTHVVCVAANESLALTCKGTGTVRYIVGAVQH